MNHVKITITCIEEKGDKIHVNANKKFS